MKKNLLLILMFALFISFEAMSQTCGRVSLIGEFNGWAGDHFMTRNPESPDLFTTILILNAASDPNGDGIVELKFRANSDWATNWGAAEFPTGIGVANGPNIPVPIGNYKVSFNCATGEYNFVTTCGEIGLIGEFNGWAADEWMTRDMANPDSWTSVLVLTAASDPNGDGIVELKFRANADWATNWGAAEFPLGIGVPDGPNIPVPVGSYLVTFNCATGAYNFLATCANIALIGEFNGWAADLWMTRNMASPNDWTLLLTLNAASDPNGDGIVELKFRANADWATNWGAAEFPTGIGVANGPNIPVPLDATGLTTDYLVTFNCATGVYNFVAAAGGISMIGAFNNWNGDVPMNRDAANPNLWRLSRVWYADSEVKFRENNDWSANWGNNTFPSGTGTANGPNIPLTAGSYDVTFNSATFEYNFVPNNTLCGEISMIGDFNSWGDDGTGTPTDVWMYRDPVYPSNYIMPYNFASSTNLWFRLNADITYTDVWGGTFPAGTGVKGGDYIAVPGGKYIVSYNCKSNDFNFLRLGNGVTAPKVFAINVDGVIDETDWKVDNVISQVVDGTPGEDLNEAYFGVAYNETYLYVAINVTDGVLMPNEQGEVFIDGNKSGGAYDENDLHMKFSGAGVEVIYGPEGITPILGFGINATGYTAEVAIPWADLGVVAEEGGQIGFDILLGDDDDGTGVAYTLAWNGGLQNYDGTSSFGDLVFGTLSCGEISLYNDVVGDVMLQNPTDAPTSYVGSYELFENQDLVFRKDMKGTVTWATDAFPAGTAVLSGPAIPATIGRYRIAFDCVTGAFTFTNEPAGAGVAYSEYTDTPPTIDGDLGEYNLSYGSDILAVGTGPINNTVSWGSRWDANNLYIGVEVVDGTVEGAGNPWDNDAIEYYFDGNHDSDGTYDGEFDTQLIQDYLLNSLAPNSDSLWVKADGASVTNFDSKWTATGTGYNVELRLGWDNFGFMPGKGRSMGFSLGNNDSDLGLGRDYQSVWYGDGNNWSNTAVLGDLQLAGGAYWYNVGEVVDYSSQIVMFPNPSASNVFLRVTSEIFNGDVTIHISDIAGRTVVNEEYNIDGAGSLIQFNADLFTPGIYIVNIIGNDGVRAVKKLIVQ